MNESEIQRAISRRFAIQWFFTIGIFVVVFGLVAWVWWTA